MPPVVKRGSISTITDTTNIKIDISEVIDQLSPYDTPIMSVVGKDSLKSPCEQILHEWLEDELRPRSGTLGAAYTVGSGTLVLAAGEGKYIYPDDLLLVGNMVFQVNSGPPSSDTCTVTLIRGTDAAAANAATWRKLAQASPEGGEARADASKTVLAKPYNYVQIIKDWSMVTGTMEVIKRYGYASERAYQEEKILKQLMIDWEMTLIYGVRSYAAGPPRKSTAGGLFEYIYLPGVTNNWDTVVNANAGQITETMLNNVLQQIWEQGGSPDTIYVNGWNKRLITGWATPRIRTAQDERIAGASINTYESDFGTLAIRLNRWLRPADVLILTMDEIGVGPLTGRQMTSRQLPVTGDYTRYEILGEYTMEVHKPQHCHGWLYNTSTS